MSRAQKDLLFHSNLEVWEGGLMGNIYGYFHCQVREEVEGREKRGCYCPLVKNRQGH